MMTVVITIVVRVNVVLNYKFFTCKNVIEKQQQSTSS